MGLPTFNIFCDSEKKTRGSVPIMSSEDAKCVCGHPASSHRTYGCIGSSTDPSKKHGRIYCECRAFKSAAAKNGS